MCQLRVMQSDTSIFLPLSSYVKGIYLQQIDAKAPNYMTEEYSGTTPCPKEDDLKESCSVKLQIAPFHADQPGLRIYYAHKNSVIFLAH